MLFSPILALSLVTSFAGAASATHLVPRAFHGRILPRQAASECTDSCQKAYDVIQDCYSSDSDVEAIAACSCGDESLSALQDCAECAATSDLSDSEKSTIESGVSDLVDQCQAAGLASTTLSGLPSVSGSMSGSMSGSSMASGSGGLLSELSGAAASATRSAVSAATSASDAAASAASSGAKEQGASTDDKSSALKATTASAALLLSGAMIFFA